MKCHRNILPHHRIFLGLNVILCNIYRRKRDFINWVHSTSKSIAPLKYVMFGKIRVLKNEDLQSTPKILIQENSIIF